LIRLEPSQQLAVEKMKRLALLRSLLEFPAAHAKLRRKQSGRSVLRESMRKIDG
jgi:hypothetical protein